MDTAREFAGGQRGGTMDHLDGSDSALDTHLSRADIKIVVEEPFDVFDPEMCRGSYEGRVTSKGHCRVESGFVKTVQYPVVFLHGGDDVD